MTRFYRNINYFIVIFVLFAGGCAALKKEPSVIKKAALTKISPSKYPVFADDMFYDGLEYSICKSISYLQKVPSVRTFMFGEDRFTADHLIKSLQYFLTYIQAKPSKHDLNRFIRSNFWIYRSIGGNGSGNVLFTGYYEPILEGSLKQSDEFSFPLYAWPDDLAVINLSLFSPEFSGKKIIGRCFKNTVVPYYERREIELQGCLEDTAEPIAWVKDRVDLFFLQIQGSGKIYLNNGKTINVHYHTSNGRPYKSVGNYLIEKGKIPRSEMSMQKIRAYLRDNPKELDTILHYNPSYVFFKIEDDGPLGCLDVKLTPGRSIALDRKIFPKAALAFIETKKPLIDGTGKIHIWKNYNRFVLNQDTGGAILGPGRADMFFGNGIYAEIAAGHMQHPGKLYFLILKPDAVDRTN
ncbi:MAG: MltA domain-containing protein [Desulfobacteraceae bacterium]|nr:MltA domain-containing protein [Pseudomonadota bacterium]MCG2755049.1 MltA domain-containing protein [Desulfobacteraceae bacterium]